MVNQRVVAPAAVPIRLDVRAGSGLQEGCQQRAPQDRQRFDDAGLIAEVV